MSPDMLERRDRFVDGLILGMSKYQAAIYAGAPPRSAHKEGSNLYCEPYVQERFRTLREAIEEENLITRKELLLNVKSIAFDDREQGGARVGASSLLAKVMGYEAPTKIQAEVEHKGGVMMVPMAAGLEDWEATAGGAQRQLKEDVRN
jgi:phage terminase small subunit